MSETATAQWYSFSHSRPHSPSEAGRKTLPLAFVTQRVTAILMANRVPLDITPREFDWRIFCEPGKMKFFSGEKYFSGF